MSANPVAAPMTRRVHVFPPSKVTPSNSPLTTSGRVDMVTTLLGLVRLTAIASSASLPGATLVSMFGATAAAAGTASGVITATAASAPTRPVMTHERRTRMAPSPLSPSIRMRAAILGGLGKFHGLPRRACRRLPLERQLQLDEGPSALRIPQTKDPSVGVSDRADDGQPETSVERRTVGRRTDCRRSIGPLPLYHLKGKPRARVADPDHHVAVNPRRGERDGPARGRVPDGVVHQVVDGLADPFRIEHCGQPFLAPGVDLDPGGGRPGPVGLRTPLQE